MGRYLETFKRICAAALAANLALPQWAGALGAGTSSDEESSAALSRVYDNTARSQPLPVDAGGAPLSPRWYPQRPALIAYVVQSTATAAALPRAARQNRPDRTERGFFGHAGDAVLSPFESALAYAVVGAAYGAGKGYSAGEDVRGLNYVLAGLGGTAGLAVGAIGGAVVGIWGALESMARAIGSLFGAESELPQPAPVPSAPVAGTEESGTLVLVQIDGLGHKRLLEAVAGGWAPNLGNLLASGEYRAAPFRNGIPTVTQSIQSQIFYGRIQPGNEWYSREKGGEVTASDLEPGYPASSGLLAGGRAYLSEFSGGAQQGADVRRMFAEDAAERGTAGAALKELSAGTPLFLRHLLQAPADNGRRFVRDTLSDVLQIRGDFKARGFDRPMDRKSAYFFALTGNVWSQVAKAGILEALEQRAPVVYTDFSTYDEYAHYYGAGSAEAFSALLKIDEQIGEIVAALRGDSKLVVFSDHGQTPTRNFTDRYGETPQQVLDRLLLKAKPGAKPGELVFSHVYSMGNIYVRGSGHRVELDEFEGLYPGLIQALLAHEGFGLVAARRNGRVALLSKEVASAAGRSPLSAYSDDISTVEVLQEQVANYMQIEESGDLVVFAPYEDGITLDYNSNYTLVSEHGGIGGEQMHPFILYPPRALPFEPEKIKDARDLNRLLKPEVGR